MISAQLAELIGRIINPVFPCAVSATQAQAMAARGESLRVLIGRIINPPSQPTAAVDRGASEPIRGAISAGRVLAAPGAIPRL